MEAVASNPEIPSHPVSPAALPPLLPPVLTPSASGPGPVPFSFHGQAAEYFRIWIVNTLLTVLTAGGFAAWAKVRKRRYLRGNTELMGHRFDYVADPRRILAGNLIMVLLFLAYGLFGSVYPVVRLFALACGVILLPWIMMRSLAFNAHNTMYRGFHFRFRQNLTETIVVFLLKPLLIIVTLGLYYPAWERARRRYVINNHRLGDAFFQFEGAGWPFYSAYLAAGALVLLAALLGGVVVAYATQANRGAPPTLTQLAPFFAAYIPALYIAKHSIYARLFNHAWNHTSLDRHRFVATMGVNRWLILQLGNGVAILGSAGLLYPWAVIRSSRYALSCLNFVPAGPIERISRLRGGDGSAVGAGAAELIGLDIGL